MKVAIFASGTGSNAEALIRAAAEKELGGEVALVLSDKRDAKVLEKAKAHGVPAYAFVPKTFASKAEYEAEVVRLLEASHVQLVVLAGYMRLVGPTLLDAYEGRIVNIHPSLLPEFPGLDAVGQALEAGVKQTGVTVHYVDAGMDTGPVIAQEAVEIHDEETCESLTAKIQRVEHVLYPRCVKQLLEDVRGSQ
ncbi:phosphoribosylglycinamide formyltransferase [Shouchella shacheensis]|uniref:phosphoribosylglycinamide formyltransferase n=1 Tax=Shouchella shacheensis TaxID=1649580 RepID=UPI00073FA8D2|nr:phosphoribosylglycinamide formyltransferase [Shouchella shacheensis]